MTTYTITTDEPLISWCLPRHEGQVVETVEQSQLKHSYGMTVPIKRRFVATQSASGALEWMEVPCPK